MVLGCGEDLLPVVPDPNATPSANSRVRTFGKIPSCYDANGHAYGLAKWQTRSISPQDLERWSADGRYSMCVRASRLRAIDIDIDDANRVAEIIERIDAEIGELPLRVRANSAKCLMPFRLEGQWQKRRFKARDGGIIEFLADGQQWVAAGSHPSGVMYEWQDGLPSEIPTLTADQFEHLWGILQTEFGSASSEEKYQTAENTTQDEENPDDALLNRIEPGQLEELRDALRYAPLVTAAGDNSCWAEIGYALLSLGATGFELWADLCQRAPNYKSGDETAWWGAHAHQDTRTDYRHIFTLARKLGWGKAADPSQFEIVNYGDNPIAFSLVPPAPAGPREEQVPTALHRCTDLANANRLYAAYGTRLRSVGGAFYVYTGTHWRRDDNEAQRLAARLAQLVRQELEVARAKVDGYAKNDPQVRAVLDLKRRDKAPATMDEFMQREDAGMILFAIQNAEALEKWEKECEMKPRQDKAIELLRRLVSVDPNTFDSNPAILNCHSGTIDLRTGIQRAHDPTDYLTFCAPVEYKPDAKAPKFEKFLGEVLDLDRAGFLRRWFGYCATGETREQKFLLHVGQGSNGKGTLFRLLQNVLGSYVHTAAPNLLMGRNERHPTEIADLFGRRIVVAHESDEGAHLREGFMKQATGEDPLSGRFMHKDFFTFQPAFKLQLLTNSKPVVKGQDYGIWRRVLMLWYHRRYGTAEDVAAGEATDIRDDSLTQQLIEEREGIFAWIVRGAREWYASGLQPPQSVTDESKRYRDEQDRVSQFIASCCILDKDAWAPYSGPFGGLYPAYTQWCRECGYPALGLGRFIERLERVVPFYRADKQRKKVDGVSKQMRGCWGLVVNPDGDGGGSRNPDSLEDMV